MTSPPYVLVGALFFSCHSRPQTLKPAPGCSTPAVVACLQPLAFEKLGEADLKRLRANAADCFSKDKAELRRQASCLPLTMGVDARGRGKVELRYHCSDLCPDHGGVIAALDGPRDVSACCAAGGEPFLDGASRRFRACMISRGDSRSPLCNTNPHP